MQLFMLMTKAIHYCLKRIVIQFAIWVLWCHDQLVETERNDVQREICQHQYDVDAQYAQGNTQEHAQGNVQDHAQDNAQGNIQDNVPLVKDAIACRGFYTGETGRTGWTGYKKYGNAQ